MPATSASEPPTQPARPRVHQPAWTREQIAAFWDNYGSIDHFRSRYFALAWSDGILEHVAPYVANDGVVLDYGCGRGDILEALIGRGLRCMGCDSSPENVRATRDRFEGRACFLGTSIAPPGPLSPPPDTVMLVEVIEHVPPASVPELLRSIAALMAPGGRIVITCPNSEDLQKAEVLCPECGCCFHPVQHLQSLRPEDVARVAAEAGFEKVIARATRFRKRGEPRLYARLLAAWYALTGRPPHLVYVGRLAR